MPTTLIIDSSKYMYHAAYACWNKDKTFLTRMSDKKRFIKKYMREITEVIKKNPYATKIVIATDSSRSWRKDIPGDVEYKGNRKKKKENKFDFALLNAVMREVEEIFVKNGICTIHVPGAEGDDIMAIIADKLYRDGESAVLVTADGDMKQCLKESSDGTFIAVYDPVKEVYYLPDGKDVVEGNGKIDPFGGLFNTLDFNDPKAHMEPLERVNPAYILFEKLVAGDPKDNVPAIYYRPRGKQMVRITESKVEQLWSKYKLNEGVDSIESMLKQLSVPDDGLIVRLIKSIRLMYTPVAGDDDNKTIIKNIIRNLTFLLLHKSVYQRHEISKDMYENVLKTADDKNFGSGISLLRDAPLDIFDGTTYDFGEYKDSVYYKNM